MSQQLTIYAVLAIKLVTIFICCCFTLSIGYGILYLSLLFALHSYYKFVTCSQGKIARKSKIQWIVFWFIALAHAYYHQFSMIDPSRDNLEDIIFHLLINLNAFWICIDNDKHRNNDNNSNNTNKNNHLILVKYCYILLYVAVFDMIIYLIAVSIGYNFSLKLLIGATNGISAFYILIAFWNDYIVEMQTIRDNDMIYCIILYVILGIIFGYFFVDPTEQFIAYSIVKDSGIATYSFTVTNLYSIKYLIDLF